MFDFSSPLTQKNETQLEILTKFQRNILDRQILHTYHHLPDNFDVSSLVVCKGIRLTGKSSGNRGPKKARRDHECLYFFRRFSSMCTVKVTSPPASCFISSVTRNSCISFCRVSVWYLCHSASRAEIFSA